MGGARTNPYVLRMQASREKLNDKKSLNRKYSSGYHTDNKGTEKKISSHANPQKRRVSADLYMRLTGACEQTPSPFWNRIDDPVRRFDAQVCFPETF
jgi:hypothetical protein